MVQKTLPTMPRARGPIRRRVQVEARNGDQIISKVKSLTRRDGTEYHPTIDTTTFESHCDCPASVFKPTEICKHRIKSALNLIRRGELDPAFLQRAGKKLCHRCGAEEDLFPMCHDDGSQMHDVFICYGCIQHLRAEKKGLAVASSDQEVAADDRVEPCPDEMPAEDWTDADADFEMRRAYLQSRINHGEYVHSSDWRHYRLTHPDERDKGETI